MLVSRQAMDTARGEAMDFSAQLEDLQKRAAEAKASVQAAATESRESSGSASTRPRPTRTWQ